MSPQRPAPGIRHPVQEERHPVVANLEMGVMVSLRTRPVDARQADSEFIVCLPFDRAPPSVHRGRPVKTGISRYSESASAFVNTWAVLCCLMCNVSSATLVKMKSNRSSRGGMPLVEVN